MNLKLKNTSAAAFQLQKMTFECIYEMLSTVNQLNCCVTSTNLLLAINTVSSRCERGRSNFVSLVYSRVNTQYVA